MQSLKSLTFIRIGPVSSHKYKPHKKVLQSTKTFNSNIRRLLDEAGICLTLDDYMSDDLDPIQDDLLQQWVDNNKELYNKYKDLNRGFTPNSFHSPPQLRGLYAFPQYRLEPFLTHWDKSKFDIKYINRGTDDETCRMRAKRYSIIKYNKPTLWCHHIEQANRLGVAVTTKNSWVLVNSKDYLKVLAEYEKDRLKEHREDMSSHYKCIKNPYMFGNNDELEVFLIGI